MGEELDYKQRIIDLKGASLSILALALAGLIGQVEGKTVFLERKGFVVSKTQVRKIEKGNAPIKVTKLAWYGKRKKVVTAILPNGEEKKMALKNALKKNLDFTF